MLRGVSISDSTHEVQKVFLLTKLLCFHLMRHA